jgi:hypothetical protein
MECDCCDILHPITHSETKHKRTQKKKCLHDGQKKHTNAWFMLYLEKW